MGVDPCGDLVGVAKQHLLIGNGYALPADRLANLGLARGNLLLRIRPIAEHSIEAARLEEVFDNRFQILGLRQYVGGDLTGRNVSRLKLEETPPARQELRVFRAV